MGLFNAIELVADQGTKAMLPRGIDHAKEISRLAMDEGLLLYARRTFAGKFGDWLMMTPPLIARPEDIDELASILSGVLRRYAALAHRAA